MGDGCTRSISETLSSLSIVKNIIYGLYKYDYDYIVYHGPIYNSKKKKLKTYTVDNS